MPLKTFFNLTESRQNEIRTLCFKEFEKHGYEGTSLTRIIGNLNIARGSFYRYFENKDDLFYYLVAWAISITDRVMNKNFKNPDISFYDAWIGNFLDLHEQEDGNISYLRFLSTLSKEIIADLITKGIIKNPTEQFLFMKEVIRIHQENGSIRTDLADLFIIVYLRQMRDFLREYLFYKNQSKSKGNSETWNALQAMSKDELQSELNLFIRFLKDTLEPGKRS